jgi:murein DD-endopeptidase MepM/ murein hydrolase activator NlpD
VHDSYSHARPRSPRKSARVRLGVVVGLLSASLFAGNAASAAPGNGAGRSDAGNLAAQVADIQARVAAAEENLQRMTVQAEAASDAVLQTRAELAAAEAEAAAAAELLEQARAAVEQARQDVVDVGREAYMGEDTYGHLAALLDAGSPEEFLERATTLEVLGDERAERLEEFEDIESHEARAARTARAAVADRDRAAREAADTEAATAAQLAAAQASYDQVAAEKARLDQQLRGAQVALLAQQGAADPEGTWALQQAVLAAGTLQVAGGAVAPTTGRVTSCYGSRWGAMHYGVDIAAPIGTPVYTPEGGVVLQAGPASGFGLAVYVQHPDGSITVYGHVNQFFVSAGQVVSAGQQIAEVGNRGQSTGPHLHFEVHHGGLYANRSNPMPWLAARGISLGGC